MIRRRDIPLARDPSGRFLPWMIAFMVLLAMIASAAALGARQLVSHWETSLTGRLTIQIPAPEGDAPSAEARQANQDAVLAVLRETPKVAEVTVLSDGEVRKLVEPWLGEAGSGIDLPLPDLIAVSLAEDAEIDLEALRGAVAEAVPGARVDDHDRWLSRLLQSVYTMQAVALAVLLLVLGTAVLAVIFVTRTGLAIHQEVIELLHLMGAEDRYVARQFQQHALWLALKGGILGAIAAIPLLVGVDHLLALQGSALIPAIEFGVLEWIVLAAMPVLAAVIAMLTARRTVLKTLSRLP